MASSSFSFPPKPPSSEPFEDAPEIVPMSPQHLRPRGRSRIAWLVAIPAVALFLSTRHIMSKTDATGPWLSSSGVKPVLAPREAKVYVYKLPDSLEADVVNDTRGDWGEYNADFWVREAMLDTARRTDDPNEADLFFIPAMPTRYLHARFRTLGFGEATEQSAQYVRRVIEHVSTAWPYWNRTDGRDHFMTLPHDKGRCTHFPSVGKDVIKDLFVLQHHGDLSAHVGEDDAFSMACYEPDRDILLPSFIGIPTVSPHTNERPINVLYRFKEHDNKGSFHGVKVRVRLHDLFETDPPPGADWRVRDHGETLGDMARSVFCVTPPGWVAHTGRFWRGIQRGCVPISFFRAYDLAFQDLLDYSAFTVNIQPDHLADLTPTIRQIMADPDRLARMQDKLEEAQAVLSWERTEPASGVEELLWDMLDARAAAIQNILPHRTKKPPS